MTDKATYGESLGAPCGNVLVLKGIKILIFVLKIEASKTPWKENKDVVFSWEGGIW